MIRALFTAATGMQAQQLNVDVIANNLANVSTVGFKKARSDFQELLYETIVPAGAQSSQNTSRSTGIDSAVEHRLDIGCRHPAIL